MKKNSLKKGISAALICSLVLTSAVPAFNVSVFADETQEAAEEESIEFGPSEIAPVGTVEMVSENIEKRTVDLYLIAPENKFAGNVYFINGTDIPYMEMTELVDVMKNWMVLLGHTGYDLDFKADGSKITLTRENGYPCVMDFTNDTVYIKDYNAFNQSEQTKTILDMVSLQETDDEGREVYLKRSPYGTYERYGADINMDLGAYNIDLIYEDGSYYMPLQTFNDIFLWNAMSSLLYNGNSLFFVNFDADGMIDAAFNETELGKIYYQGEKTNKVSEALGEFNYNELCFALDHLYGLKENHKIESFDKLMTETGLKDEMLSGDSRNIDVAIYELSTRLLDDIHTKYGIPSCATGSQFRKDMIQNYGEGYARDYIFALTDELKAARAKYYPNGVPGYEEVGDTAFITFDEFEMFTEDVDHYAQAPTAETKDTIGLIAYSVQQILRENSPVKNVVLDLSCNGGGAADTAVDTVGAFLGKTRLSVEDSYTGALVATEYLVDTNLDHEFNEKDYLAGKGLNLYCLESNVSFSCGNLVPCMFKQSSDVSLLGETSGGGACSVLWISTATGAAFRISSPNRLSFLKNGSFYDVDRGADPDYYIGKKDSYFNREKLVEYIHSLM